MAKKNVVVFHDSSFFSHLSLDDGPPAAVEGGGTGADAVACTRGDTGDRCHSEKLSRGRSARRGSVLLCDEAPATNGSFFFFFFESKQTKKQRRFFFSNSNVFRNLSFPQRPHLGGRTTVFQSSESRETSLLAAWCGACCLERKPILKLSKRPEKVRIKHAPHHFRCAQRRSRECV